MAIPLPSLSTDFGFCAKHKINYKAVINSTFVPSADIDSYTKELIEALAMAYSLRTKGMVNPTFAPEGY